MQGQSGYEKRNGRDKPKDSNNQGSTERRTDAPPKKKPNLLVIAGIVGGIFLLLIIIIAASSCPTTDSNSAGTVSQENLEEEDKNISELRDSAGANEAEADRLVAEDDRKAADRYYRSAYDKYERALAIVRRLAELHPGTKYSIQEQEIERQLAEIKANAGFNIGE